VFLPLEATTETMESPGEICSLQFTNYCAPSESILSLSFDPREMFSIRSPAAAPRMLALKVTL
jgi:hypothetical protein